MTTDFENHKKRQKKTNLYAFFGWPSGPYPTELVQSILQPEISSHVAHFWFPCKN